MNHQSTKIIQLGSCAFRQPNASHSHCRFIHGYNLYAKFTFGAFELDENNWIADFGGLKGLKQKCQKQFDHTTCLAADDPVLPIFKELVKQDACDLRIMPKGTGIERIAEWCWETANSYVKELTKGRCWCEKVEVWEHENNSAVFHIPDSEAFSITQERNNNVELLVETNVAGEDVVSEAVEQSSQPQPVTQKQNTNLYNKKTTNTWIDKDSVNKKNSWAF